MDADIREYVKICATCEKTKYGPKTRSPLQISSTGNHAMQHIFLDYLGPISPPSNCYNYVFMANCDLTKFLIAIPTRSSDAETTAKCIINKIILKYNFPELITTDNASYFTGKTLKELNKQIKVRHVLTSPYVAKSNVVKRANRTVNAYMRAFTEKNPKNWINLIPYAAFS